VGINDFHLLFPTPGFTSLRRIPLGENSNKLSGCLLRNTAAGAETTRLGILEN
jgi:hypothetical protein